MATIKSFKGIRPRKDLADKIAALPYDVYNREEATKIVKENPLSFLAIDRAETSFSRDVSTYDDKVYEKAKELLNERIQNGCFIEDDSDCLYLYELEMNGRIQTGIVCLASVDDYVNNIIKKHENTRADKEQDRIRHVDTCNAQTGPIFLAYKENSELKTLIQTVKQENCEVSFVSEDNVKHTVYVIKDKDIINRIVSVFDGIENLYIADGHHRAASAVKTGLMRREKNNNQPGEYDYFLSVLFSDNELNIMDYNRVVKDLNGLNFDSFMARIDKVFQQIEISNKPIKPEHKGQLTMYLNNNWYRLNIRDEYKNNDPVNGMDVSILQNNILSPVLGIEDPKTNDRIEFVGGIRGIDCLMDKCNDVKDAVAFVMHPVSMEELFNVSDAGLLMPPKSTWFEPKLRSGLFIHKI